MLSSAQRITVCLVVLLVFVLTVALPAEPAAVTPESVIVVANKTVPGSVRIARKYAKMRGIPKSNLIFLDSGDGERLSRQEYNQTIHNPLLEQLIGRNLINAIKGSEDDFGRTTVTIIANPLRYIVLCYGVPTTIANMPIAELDDHVLRTNGFTGRMTELGKSFENGPLAKNMASVDGELALLLQRDVPFNGFIPNPFFRNRTPEKVIDFLKVMRLDGPTPEAVFHLLENTLAGEKHGLRGRAYVDLDGRSGAYQVGNDWMSRAAEVFEELGFSLARHPAPQTFPPDSRFDAPVLYAGWYAGKVEGPFALPGFKLAPGAVAAHLHSVSAKPLRSLDKGWVGPLINAGACATFGNVAEPYLPYTHHFDMYFAALTNGWNVADAAYFALPALSWQAISVGDPFYRPFAIPLEKQLESLGEPEGIHLDQYVVMRKMNLLEREEQVDEALKMCARGMLEYPGPALALEQARLLEMSGRKGEARDALSLYAGIIPTDPNDWGLYADIADNLLRLEDPGSAFHIYLNLKKVKMPEKVQLAFLNRGIQSARKAGDNRKAEEWNLLVNPPPPTVVPEMPNQTRQEPEPTPIK